MKWNKRTRTAPGRIFRHLLAGASLVVLASAAQAQQAESQSAEDDQGSADAIIVTAKRIAGSVETDVPPDLVLDGDAIESYGASNVSDLLAALSTQTRTGRGRQGGAPVVLVNGRRVSGMSEIRDLPPEAIQRVETFPEEVALRYGYSADQRVVNFILKPDFSALTGEIELGGSTSGARADADLQATWLRIGEKGRTNLSAQYNRASAVLESERGIVQTVPGLAESRTLSPSTKQIQLNSVFNRALSDTIGATLNLKYDQTDNAALFGLSTPVTGIAERLEQDSRSRTADAGLTVDGSIGQWQWTGTATHGVDTSRTLTDPISTPSATRDTARSRQATTSLAWSASGPLARLPAGPVTASIRAGFERRAFRSHSSRSGVTQKASLGRNEATARASLDIPLASRARGVAEALGDLSVNINAAYRHLGDFGGLNSFGYGLTWSPSRSLHLVASLAVADGAPSQQQLRNPLVALPGVTVYDYMRGQSALVTIIGGGNPLLRTERTRDLKLGLSYDVPKVEGLSLSSEYYRNRSDNPLSVFPELTTEIERAFPGRVVRAADGTLVSIDRRAINYLSTSSDEIRWGINFSRQSGQPQGRQGMGAGGGIRFPGAGGAGGRSPGSGGRGGFGGPGKRLQLSLLHTFKLNDEIRIAPGLPALDLLNGSATGAFGGTPEHRIDLEGGWYNNGLGMRLTAGWQSGTTVEGGPVPGGTATDLRFSGLATINLRLFVNFSQRKKLVEKIPFLKGSRLRLRINNITNAIREVRDETGATPLRYQPGYMDALGRTVEISFRKLF